MKAEKAAGCCRRPWIVEKIASEPAGATPRGWVRRSRYAGEGGALQAVVSSAWVFSAPPLTLRFDGSYSKRVPVAVEQPVLYSSPLRR